MRVWDNHLGTPHLHRYTKQEGKQDPETVAATTQEGLDLALEAARERHPEIIESWKRS